MDVRPQKLSAKIFVEKNRYAFAHSGFCPNRKQVEIFSTDGLVKLFLKRTEQAWSVVLQTRSNKQTPNNSLKLGNKTNSKPSGSGRSPLNRFANRPVKQKSKISLQNKKPKTFPQKVVRFRFALVAQTRQIHLSQKAYALSQKAHAQKSVPAKVPSNAKVGQFAQVSL